MSFLFLVMILIYLIIFENEEKYIRKWINLLIGCKIESILYYLNWMKLIWCRKN